MVNPHYAADRHILFRIADILWGVHYFTNQEIGAEVHTDSQLKTTDKAKELYPL